MISQRRHRVAALAAGPAIAAALLASACGRPHTDIVATNPEDVGDYTVVGTRDGDALRARVCVSDASHTDAVTERILQQLYSQGLHTIALDVYDGRIATKRVVWAMGTRRAEPVAGPAPAGVCGRTR